MKKILFPALAMVLFVACNNEASSDANNETENTATEAEHSGDDDGMMMEDHEGMMAHTKNGDPVCGMDYDASWTEYTVDGSDTTWFCSETCKTAYLGNPAKYKK